MDRHYIARKSFMWRGRIIKTGDKFPEGHPLIKDAARYLEVEVSEPPKPAPKRRGRPPKNRQPEEVLDGLG